MKIYGRQGRKLGQAPVALIIFVVLTLAAGGVAFVMYQALSKTKVELTSATAQLAQTQASLDGLTHRHNALKAAAGWETAEQITPFLAPQKPLPSPAGAPPPILYPRTASAKSLLEQLMRTNEDYYRMLVQKHQAFEQENKKRLAVEADKNMIIMKRDEEIQAVKDGLATEIKRIEKARDEAKEALARESQAHAADVEALQQLKTELDKTRSQLAQTQERIEVLTATIRGTEREKGLALLPDGKIVSVSRQYGFAFIDLGKADAIRPGMRFTVFREVTTGNLIVGQVEVRSVGDMSSQAAIIEQAQGEPIIDGDLIANLAYDKEKPVVFVFAGELKQYSFDQARRAAVNYGAQVSQTISPQVTYLVVGQNPGTAIKEAKDLGVPVMTEEEFLRFVGRPF